MNVLWIVLAVALAVLAALLFSGHIPVLRELTGAAPLEPEPLPLLAGDMQADFVASLAAGHMQPVTWDPKPAPAIELPLPADDTEEAS